MFCYKGDGASYRGRKTTTKSGRICQNWVSQSPHKHYATCCHPESNPNAGLVDNFCRNPDNEPEGPWCYTTDASVRWEYCGVQKCTENSANLEGLPEGAILRNLEKFIVHEAVEEKLSFSKCEENSLESTTRSTREEERIFTATAKSGSCWLWLQKRIKTNSFQILRIEPAFFSRFFLGEQIRHLRVKSDELTCELKKKSDFVTPIVYDGTPGASSQYSASYSAEKAFDSENDDRWCSAEGFPAKIWFQFTSAVKVVKISFSSPEPSRGHQKWKQSPKAFQVIASDDCSNWDTLLSVTDSGFTGAHQEKSWQIPCNQQKSYHCYGIEGNENFGFHTDYISVHKMKMFQ